MRREESLSTLGLPLTPCISLLWEFELRGGPFQTKSLVIEQSDFSATQEAK